MILVTGGFGFIGSAVVRDLLAAGHRVLVADDVTNGDKLRNLADVGLAHYLDRDELRLSLCRDDDPYISEVTAIVHLGARTDTTETDGSLLFDLNYRSSRQILEWCTSRNVPLVYASSASVYGRSGGFREHPDDERPLNPYAQSKLVFDNLVREHHARGATTGVLGLRFFNVYGPREEHKGTMASVIRHFATQATVDGVIRPFGASHGYAAGQQERDFVHVDDVVAVIRWALAAAESGQPVNGIVNVGTGHARTFQSIAELVQSRHSSAGIEYRDFPDELAPAYQPYTCADLTRLRDVGYTGNFRSIDEGVPGYVDWLAGDRT